MAEDRCFFQRINLSNYKKDKNKIVGINVFNTETTKKEDNPKGYCGYIGITGNYIEIKTDGKYRFIPKKKALKLFKELLKQEVKPNSSHS